MISFPYSPEDIKKLNQAIVDATQALRNLGEDSQGQQLKIAIQNLDQALREFPARTYPGEHYARLTMLLHVLTDMRKTPEWSDRLAIGELSEMTDQLVQIIHQAVNQHEIFKAIAMPSLAFLTKRQILVAETDPEKQIALFPQYDEQTKEAMEQYIKLNEIAEHKNVEMAAYTETVKKRKFSGQAPTEELVLGAATGMTELYAIMAAAALAGDIATTLHVYRGVVIEHIEQQLLGGKE